MADPDIITKTPAQLGQITGLQDGDRIIVMRDGVPLTTIDAQVLITAVNQGLADGIAAIVGTTGLTIDELRVAIQSAAADAEAAAASVAGVANMGLFKSIPLLSGYDAGGIQSIGQGDLVVSTGLTQASIVWNIDNVQVGDKVTLELCVAPTENVVAYLADGNSAPKGPSVALAEDSVYHVVTLQATTGIASRLVLLQNPAVPGHHFTFWASGVVGDQAATGLQQNKLLTAQLARMRVLQAAFAGVETARSALSARTEGLGGITGQPTSTSYTNFTVTDTGKVSGTAPAAAGQVAVRWPMKMALGEKKTVLYAFTRTGATLQMFLDHGDGTSATVGGAKNMVADGKFHPQVLEASDTVQYLDVMQTTGVLSTMSGRLLTIDGDITALLPKNALHAFLAMLTSMFADNAAQTDSRLNLAEARIAGLMDSMGATGRFSAVGARNFFPRAWTTTPNAHSVTRTVRNGTGDANNVRVFIANSILATAGDILAQLPNANGIRGHYTIEYPIGTAPVPLKRNGSADIWFKRSELGGWIFPDPGALSIPGGALYKRHVRFYPVDDAGNLLAGGTLPCSQFAVSTDHYNVNSTVDRTSTIGGETAAFAGGQDLFDGAVVACDEKAYPTIVVPTDSQGYGFAENLSGTGDADGNTGPWGRWYGKYHMDAVIFGLPSSTLSQWALSLSGRLLPSVGQLLACMGRHYQVSLGRNSLGAGATAAQMLAQLDCIEAYLIATGRTGRCATVTPHPTATTDNWASFDHMTAETGAIQAERVSFNTAAISRGAVDFGGLLEDPAHPGCCVTNGAAFGFMQDGTHYNAGGHALFANTAPDPTQLYT